MFEYRTKVLAVVNQKGGVGKTTVVSVLGEFGGLHWQVAEGKKKRDARILIVDLDMQCNTSDYFVGMEAAPQVRGGQLPPKHPDFDGSDEYKERSTIADIFDGLLVLPHVVQLKSKIKNVEIDVIVGHPKELEEINEKFDRASGEIDRKVVNRLGQLLHSESVADYYDLVILDTGPSRNPTFRAALRAATHAVVPFEPEEKSLQGVNSMAQAIASENFNRKKSEVKLKVVGLLPNKVRIGVQLHKDIINKITKNLSSLAMPEGVFLPLSIAFPKRDVKGARPKSIFDLRASDNARKKSIEVCEYIYNSVFETGKA
jgi:chromosome partitioning protein